jgi:hypothetical protein
MKSLFEPLYRWLTRYMGACGLILYGSKGSKAPPPDPRLVEAQLKSMGIQDAAIEQIMGNVQRLAPLQEEQMRFGIEANRTAFEQSQADREYSLERRGQLTGMQDKLVDEANSFDTAQRRNELAAEAGADAEMAFANQRQATGRSMARMGINPSSGKAAAVSAQLDLSQSAAKAGLMNSTRRAAREEGRSLTDRATNALAGYPAMSMQTTGQGATMAAGGINIANAGVTGINSGSTSAAQVAGQMGSNATSMYGAQANYKNQQDQIAASSDPFASLLGAGAQLGAAYLGKSDRRLKADIVLVGVDSATGLNLYEFRYLNSLERWRGVMADEVLQTHPDAVVVMEDGFMSVNYALLGLEMTLVKGETA